MADQINRFGRIGVLMGGSSSEREISLKSGHAVYAALSQLGAEVVAVDVTTDNRQEVANLIKSQGIDCAFLALHGRFGEDGGIQQILDDLGILYTGSGVTASKLAMDKIASRKIFADHGLPVPGYRVLEKASGNTDCKSNLVFPLVVKPATHGSSIGLSIVDREEDLAAAIDLAFSYDERILIEDYIPGREVTVGILNEEALPVIEIIPKKRFFDFQAKYQTGMTDYVVPAVLEEAVAKKVQSNSLAAHKLLGCFGCSRVDMILNNSNIPFVLEVNTIPGFTATSLLPKAANLIGMDFGHLCLKLIELTYEKT